MRCPDHPKELKAHSTGGRECPFCRGVFLNELELGGVSPGCLQQLAIETRERSAAYAKVRSCPSCAVPMVPFRIAKLEAWVERCGSCEHYWLERSDLTVLTQLIKRQRRETAYQEMPEAERRELASSLAGTVAEDREPELTTAQVVLGMLGIPSIQRVQGNRVPIATWSIAAVLIILYVFSLMLPEELGPRALGLNALDPTLATLFAANWVHFGLFHLLGNVGFLLAFGDGVEQWVSHAKLLLFFTLLGSASLGIEAALTSHQVLIAGASGGVAALMGACLVLQPRARVLFLFKFMPLRIPLPLFCGLWFLYQLVMAMLGRSNVAWVAHASGFVLGVGAALLSRRSSARDADASHPSRA